MTCYNKYDFKDSDLAIGNQFIKDNLLEGKQKIGTDLTCVISSLSLKVDDEEDDRYINGTNKFFNRKQSGGLNGGSIAAIVIVSSIILIGVAILIALIKNGAFAQKPNMTNLYSNNSAPQISSSSAQII